ncbi:hypothetical protein L1987_03298 [Smallanthus sonchifolius]|uniref:Uncharacterized protein n=1 Tax=Smallanthus sonchifolius TaxID=185202 RepID=A0ACB9KAC2_9ASTR|nr:hypothetical protein L1987_03298 [Smallanthus sonchifolius]
MNPSTTSFSVSTKSQVHTIQSYIQVGHSQLMEHSQLTGTNTRIEKVVERRQSIKEATNMRNNDANVEEFVNSVRKESLEIKDANIIPRLYPAVLVGRITMTS